MPIIFRKTAKGLSEIETRANRLAPRMRSTLILVDGKRCVDDLKLLIPQHTDETLQALAEQGLIEAVAETLGVAAPSASYAVTPTPTPTPTRAPAPQPVSRPTVDLLAVRRQAARALREELGPSARLLVIRIERSRNAEELKPLLSQAVQLVVAARGRTAAAAFATRMPVL